MLARALPCMLVVGGLALGAGCEGVVDVEVEDVVGTYVLKRVAGDTLPALLDRTAEFKVRVVHESLRLRPDGTGRITSVVDLFRIEDGVFVERRTITRELEYVLDDGRIEILEQCPPEAGCVTPPVLIAAPGRGWFPRGRLRAFSPFGGPALLYVRVSSAFEA